jgi:hypothetical protein
MNEGQSNQPRSGGIEVSPGREPRVWMGRTPEPRCGGADCETVSFALNVGCFIRPSQKWTQWLTFFCE